MSHRMSTIGALFSVLPGSGLGPMRHSTNGDGTIDSYMTVFHEIRSVYIRKPHFSRAYVLSLIG